MACSTPQQLTTFATLLGPVVIIFVITAFATDHWLDTDVDRSKLNDIEKQLSKSNQEMARIFHSRNKGIIRECYKDDSATFLNEAQNVVDNDCFYINFDDPEGIDMSDEYTRRMELFRGVLATYVLGMVGVILTFIIGIVLCFTKNNIVALTASVTCFFGALFILMAIVLFHATEYVEANNDGSPGEIVFQNTWSKKLLKATDSEFGYSYAFAWVGLILALLDGILYFLVARAMRKGGMKDSSSTSYSSTDRQHVIKDFPSESNEIYDNYGMKYGAYPMPMYLEGQPPTFMQTLPSYLSMTYGNSVYRLPEAEFRTDA